MKSYGLFNWDGYFEKGVKETSSHTRTTQFPGSKTSYHTKEKSEIESGKKPKKSRKTSSYRYDDESGNIRVQSGAGAVGHQVDKEIPATAKYEKELKNASLHASLDEILEKGWGKIPGVEYATRAEVRRAIRTENQSDKDYIAKLDKYMERYPKQPSPKNKENKNASLHASLDELLEKARPRASERKDPNRRKAEAPDDNLIIPDTKTTQTMGNPGPTEAEHYERQKGGSIENLKKLAESKSAMDRRAAAKGLKRHE